MRITFKWYFIMFLYYLIFPSLSGTISKYSFWYYVRASFLLSYSLEFALYCKRGAYLCLRRF